MTISQPVSTPTARPALVTVLVVLTVLGGVVAIAGGVVAVVAAGSFVGAGLLSILLGLVYLAVAGGLARGNPTSRIVVAVVSGVQLVVAVLTVITTGDDKTRSGAIGTGVIAVVILAVLFSPGANAFFASRRR